MKLPIFPYGHPILHQICVLVEPDEFGTPMLGHLESDMRDTCEATESGVGLAAPQVGENLQFFVMRQSSGTWLSVANPKILEQGEQVLDWEGCLSIPGFKARVPAPVSLVVEFNECGGTRVQKTLTGMDARVFWHEYRHIMGFTIVESAREKDLRLGRKHITAAKEKAARILA